MRVAAMNNPGNELIEELDTLSDLGFNVIELAIEGPKAKSDKLNIEDLKKFREGKEKEKNPIKFISHAPWEFNFGSPYEKVRKGTLEEAEEILETAKNLDIDFITMHAYSHVSSAYKENSKEDVISSFLDSAKKLISIANQKEITIGFENVGNLIKLKDFPKMFKEIPDMKMTFDIGHAYKELGEEDEVIDFIKEYKDRISHIHIHDNFGRKDDHFPLGVGKMKWKKIINALKETGYDKNITAEVHSSDREYLYISKRKIERAWRSQ